MAATNTTTSPPSEEIASLIAHEAYAAATERISRMEFVSLDDTGPEGVRTLSINRGTPWLQQIRLDTGNTVSVQDPQLLDMPIRAPGNRVFQAAWRNLLTEAERAISEHVIRVMGHGATKLLEEDETVLQALRHAARGACSHTGLGYVRNPTQAGDHLLHQLLGKEQVSQTLAIAGATATLRDFNLIALNRDQLTQAHRLSPNATTLWIRYHGQDLPDGHPVPEPGMIVGQARITVQGLIPLSEHRISPDALWDAFVNLNQQAVNDFPDPASLVHVALETAHAGAAPTHTAIRVLIRHYISALENTGPRPLIAAFITESARRLEKRRQGTQSQLATEMTALLSLPTQVLRRTAAQAGSKSWAPWHRLAETAPTGEDERPPPTRTQHHGAAADDVSTRQLLDTLINEHLPTISEEIDNTVRVETPTPGRVRLTGPQGHLLGLELRANGTIRVSGEGYFTGALTLPDPTGTGSQGNISTRGAAAKHAAEAAASAVSQHWPGDQPIPSYNRILAAYQRIAQTRLTAETLARNDDQTITETLQRAVASLLSPTAWLSSVDLTGEVTLRNYNRNARPPQFVPKGEGPTPCQRKPFSPAQQAGSR